MKWDQFFLRRDGVDSQPIKLRACVIHGAKQLSIGISGKGIIVSIVLVLAWHQFLPFFCFRIALNSFWISRLFHNSLEHIPGRYGRYSSSQWDYAHHILGIPWSDDHFQASSSRHLVFQIGMPFLVKCLLLSIRNGVRTPLASSHLPRWWGNAFRVIVVEFSYAVDFNPIPLLCPLLSTRKRRHWLFIAFG